MDTVVERYRAPLLFFFNSRSQTHWDAEELTQEVFYKLSRCKFFKNESCPEAYLFTVAWSVLRDKDRRDRARKKDKHDVFDEVDEELLLEEADSMEQIMSGEECRRRFKQGLDELSPKTRSVFLLNRYEGFTYSEIAEEFGISVSAVEKHVMIALARLKETVKE